MDWSEVVAVAIRTSADGPFEEDVFWQFLMTDGWFEVPAGDLDVLYAHLPGLDSEKLIRASMSTRPRVFRVWHRDEPRFTREQLAARFAALVETLGGVPDAAVFDRLYAAWSAPARRYHDVEHLGECLRELDGVGGAPVAELALWYHDLVYEPGASDCEERSALALVADGHLPARVMAEAADLVRATAHGRVSSAGAELVVDIDLAILGRDTLRFMDYEYGVEEEFAFVPTAEFLRARGRFLASLLARPHIFQTAHFRAKYEQSARGQIAALLRSPRYAGHVA